MVARIDAFLKLCREQGCSDVHFTVGRPPLVRLDGDLAAIKYRDLTDVEIASMVDEILPEGALAEVGSVGATDLSYVSESVGRFRVNVCRSAFGMTMICRVIPETVPTLESLSLPPITNEIADLSSGLVLVTGACGTGKSTTLASIVDRVNRTRSASITTLEDPVEFVHTSKSCLVVQREIGTSANGFAGALRSALRQDPDVILVGEMRDVDTISLALEAAETGHLVLATLHTRSAAQTVDRILDAFPGEQSNQVRTTLAENLRYVLSQRLVKAADGRGRRAAVEVLAVTSAVSQLIREGKTHQIPGVMATGIKHGMQLMDHALLKLVRAGDADPEDAVRYATDRKEFLPHLAGADASPGSRGAA